MTARELLEELRDKGMLLTAAAAEVEESEVLSLLGIGDGGGKVDDAERAVSEAASQPPVTPAAAQPQEEAEPVAETPAPEAEAPSPAAAQPPQEPTATNGAAAPAETPAAPAEPAEAPAAAAPAAEAPEAAAPAAPEADATAAAPAEPAEAPAAEKPSAKKKAVGPKILDSTPTPAPPAPAPRRAAPQQPAARKPAAQPRREDRPATPPPAAPAPPAPAPTPAAQRPPLRPASILPQEPSMVALRAAAAAKAKAEAEAKAKLAAAAKARQEAEAKAKREAEIAKRFNATDIAKLLQSKEQAQSTGSAAPQINRTASLGTERGSSQKLSPSLRAQLVGIIQEQLLKCWNVPIALANARGAVVPQVRMKLGTDGSLMGQPGVVNSSSDPLFRVAADSALTATRRCAPLRIPAQFAAYYDDWRDVIVNFDARDVL